MNHSIWTTTPGLYNVGFKPRALWRPGKHSSNWNIALTLNYILALYPLSRLSSWPEILHGFSTWFLTFWPYLLFSPHRFTFQPTGLLVIPRPLPSVELSSGSFLYLESTLLPCLPRETTDYSRGRPKYQWFWSGFFPFSYTHLCLATPADHTLISLRPMFIRHYLCAWLVLPPSISSGLWCPGGRSLTCAI